MNASSIISNLKLKRGLSKPEASWFANGLADGTVSDAQAGAFAMAVWLNGLSKVERTGLTCAMRDTGDILKWDFPGPVLEKHSTGGIGDSTTLVLVPALAACGAFVPTIAGRGLGHTGGTLDKMEAIPGFKVEFSQDELQRIVGEIGGAIVGATGNIAPADKRLYAVRDVTSTVDSIDLITASILSKKLAAGVENMVLDIKCGSGAFMKTHEDALRLAEALVGTANEAGCNTIGLITDMNQPLAPAAGNAVEIREVLHTLMDAPGRLRDLSLALGAPLLAKSGLVENEEIGMQVLQDVLASGRAAEVFGRLVHAQGGPADFVEKSENYLPKAPLNKPLLIPAEGYVSSIDGECLGHIVVGLGGGRKHGGEQLDYSVGLSGICELGRRVSKGAPLLTIHAQSEEGLARAEHELTKAFEISDVAPSQQQLVIDSVELFERQFK
jgi:thymidine phosphorylase